MYGPSAASASVHSRSLPSMELHAHFGSFTPIGLEEMDRVRLQVRTDTKFAFPERLLPELLATMRSSYRLLHTDHGHGTDYRTLYYDTPGLEHYLDHHNGRTFRSKVRFREYIGSDLFYLEVKRKTGRGDTDKARTRVQAIPDGLSAEQTAFVQEAGRMAGPWRPVLWNNFSRLTFVHGERAERLTIDRALTFRWQEREADLDGLCIAELKEERGSLGSPFAHLMRLHGIRPTGMSKYCMGMVLTGQAPKYNTFKEVLLRAERLRAA